MFLLYLCCCNQTPFPLRVHLIIITVVVVEAHRRYINVPKSVKCGRSSGTLRCQGRWPRERKSNFERTQTLTSMVLLGWSETTFQSFPCAKVKPTRTQTHRNRAMNVGLRKQASERVSRLSSKLSSLTRPDQTRPDQAWLFSVAAEVDKTIQWSSAKGTSLGCSILIERAALSVSPHLIKFASFLPWRRW